MIDDITGRLESQPWYSKEPGDDEMDKVQSKESAIPVEVITRILQMSMDHLLDWPMDTWDTVNDDWDVNFYINKFGTAMAAVYPVIDGKTVTKGQGYPIVSFPLKV